ncbi:thiamine phosphate synthase [Halobacillus campisalis]|uniref:Thiamine phosphate synthase n=1 Tax=Halobacillus campisalis TaxID=435909 RepID=A0ABW2K3G4_9BACI|nr:thiamine phosphate synthase [Halobacillus campisalis]
MVIKLIGVTDGKMEESILSEVIKRITPLLDSIILREYQKTPKEYISFINKLVKTGVDKRKLFVHDRADIACIAGVNNLHLTERGLSVNEVKKEFPHLKVGVSVHSFRAAELAEMQGADYVMFGHVYSTKSKMGLEPRGVATLEEIISTIQIPVIAIGGITVAHLKTLQDSNVAGVAVMSGIFNEEDPLAAVENYKREMGKDEQKT